MNKFKIGDWVTRALDNYEIANGVKLAQIHKVNGDKYVIKLPSGLFVNYMYEHIKLWQPKDGEWCVFYDLDSQYEYHVAKYKNFYQNDNKCYTEDGKEFEAISPLEFLETLKDKQ